MNKKINMELIIYKAQLFGINAKLIPYLIESNLAFDKNNINKFSIIFDAVFDIEKSSQISL